MRLIELIEKLTALPDWMKERDVTIGIWDESYDIEIVDDGEIELQPVGFYTAYEEIVEEVEEGLNDFDKPEEQE